MSPVIVKGIPALTVHRERRIGTRVGPLALDWDGDTKPLLSEQGWVFDGRLNANLLISRAKHACDGGDQLVLPTRLQTAAAGRRRKLLDAGNHAR